MQPAKILRHLAARIAPYMRKLMGWRPAYVSAYESATGTPAYKNDKAILLDAARMTYNNTSSASAHHANAAQWVSQLLQDQDIPAKRRLYTAANIMSGASHGPSDSLMQMAASNVFNQLMRSPGIKHKYRLRAARHVLREASSDTSREFARRAIGALAPISQQPTVSALKNYTIYGPYPQKAIKSAIRSGSPLQLPKAPTA